MEFKRVDIFGLVWISWCSQFVQIFKKKIIDEYWLPIVGKKPDCIWEWCDGAASQFKCGAAFADISESEMELGYSRVRFFYETSHAKGEDASFNFGKVEHCTNTHNKTSSITTKILATLKPGYLPRGKRERRQCTAYAAPTGVCLFRWVKLEFIWVFSQNKGNKIICEVVLQLPWLV